MRNHLIMLPGWGVGSASLAPLAHALRALDSSVQVDIQPLPLLDSPHPSDWVDTLDAALPSDVWLAGWSLGGMLASELAARRQERCRGLLTLASNACFVARHDWTAAMAAQTFSAFRDGCARDPASTLKRFSLLCSQGSADPRQLARHLVAERDPLTDALRLAGLDVLGSLDTRAALQAFGGPQMHLLADNDALVPNASAQSLQSLLGTAKVAVLASAAHAFVREQPHAVAMSISAFISEAGDDRPL